MTLAHIHFWVSSWAEEHFFLTETNEQASGRDLWVCVWGVLHSTDPSAVFFMAFIMSALNPTALMHLRLHLRIDGLTENFQKPCLSAQIKLLIHEKVKIAVYFSYAPKVFFVTMMRSTLKLHQCDFFNYTFDWFVDCRWFSAAKYISTIHNTLCKENKKTNTVTFIVF